MALELCVTYPRSGKSERTWYSPPLDGPTRPMSEIDSNLISPDMSIFARFGSISGNSSSFASRTIVV